jgi:RHS repeat-associated protein
MRICTSILTIALVQLIGATPAGECGEVTVWRFDGSAKRWQATFTGDLASQNPRPPKLAVGEAVFVHTDQPIELEVPDPALRIMYYHEDHLGSSSVVTDAAGALVEETAYYPFGATRHEERLRQVEAHYDFTQKERDRESGLHYFESRYLASGVSRFISVDRKYVHPDRLTTNELASVLANPQKLNNYGYVMNNPVRWIDPKGFAPGDPFNTPEEAATDALIAANPKSMKENREYGGKIYHNVSSMRYYATVPATGDGDSFSPSAVSVPPGTITVGDYHTHADYTWKWQTPLGTIPIHPVPKALDSYASDRFSQTDLTGIAADAAGVPGYKGYLGTPSGNFQQFNPATGVVSPLSSAPPVSTRTSAMVSETSKLFNEILTSRSVQ